MVTWYSIEVFDGSMSAALWAEAHGDALVEAAVTSGAMDWAWHHHSWGVVLEVQFADESSWDVFCDLAAVKAALEVVPDPLTGLIMYRGRGGSSGRTQPRRPRPLAGAGSAALPLPWDPGLDEVASVWSLISSPSTPVPSLAGHRR